MNSINEVAVNAASLAPASSPAASQALRRLALIQQIKDTITIVLMLVTGIIIFGIIFGIAIPGLVLYCLRWQLVRAGGYSARNALCLWLLTLAHELVCFAMFYDGHPQHSDLPPIHFELGYALGAAVSVAALLHLSWAAAGKQGQTHER